MPLKLTCSVCHVPQPFRECRLFDRCSVNICPLDPDRDLRTHCSADPETICRLPRSEQREFGAEYPDLLPWLAPKIDSAKKVPTKIRQTSVAGDPISLPPSPESTETGCFPRHGVSGGLAVHPGSGEG